MPDQPTDRAVLAKLASGDNRSEMPWPIEVRIYGTARDLGDVSRGLEECGWSIVSFVVDALGEREWDAELILFRAQTADEDAPLAMSDEIEAALWGTSAVYDGWETSIEIGTNATLH